MHAVEPPKHSLNALFAAVRDEDAELGASPEVEQRLADAFRAHAAERRRARRLTLAAAAALLVAVVAPLGWLARLEAPADPPQAISNLEVTTEFFPLVDGALPAAGALVVRLELPSTALLAFGLNAGALNGSTTVLADVVVGEEGLARAVRFVQPIR